MHGHSDLPPVVAQLLGLLTLLVATTKSFILDLFLRFTGSRTHDGYSTTGFASSAPPFHSTPSSDPKNLIGRTVRLNAGSVYVESLLGEGGFAYVYQCGSSSSNDGGEKYALKVSSMDNLEQARKELEVGRIMECNNVCGVVDYGNIDDNPGMDVGSCYLLFPFLPLSLRSHLNTYTTPVQSPLLPVPFLPAPLLHALFTGILSGVKHMHSKGWIHGDLKVDNVMIRDGQPVIVDMGSAHRPLTNPVVTRSQASRLADDAASNTTVIIRPPELFEGGLRQGDKFDAAKHDVWSLGCMCYALHFGWSPFEVEYSRDGRGLRYVDCSQLRVLGDGWDRRQNDGKVGEMWERFDREGWREVTKRCLSQKQEDRCGVDGILGDGEVVQNII